MSLFPEFPWLPQELQDTVWDFTVQNEPSLHFFRLTASLGHLTLEAPRYKQQDQPSWTINNNSYYSHFRALWNACRASRQAVERYKQNSLVVALPAAPPYVIWNRERDILCLQPSAYKPDRLPKLEDSIFDDLYSFSAAIKRIPQFDQYCSVLKEVVDIRLAIEYYPSWWEKPVDGFCNFNPEICDWAHGIVTYLEDEANGSPTFYVIDTLRRLRLDGCLDICSRRPAFESRTHYYIEAEAFDDELFGNATEAVYLFADELYDRTIREEDESMGGWGLLTMIFVVAAIPKAAHPLLL
ncbi:hypothetical protein F4819DRAFT_461503 [Hypoxylon fuscum]|nr:hypothetical protein F4819DRAFT_461503 [Hypoxylon fuscum]